jgi:hypothetical protein
LYFKNGQFSGLHVTQSKLNNQATKDVSRSRRGSQSERTNHEDHEQQLLENQQKGLEKLANAISDSQKRDASERDDSDYSSSIDSDSDDSDDEDWANESDEDDCLLNG